jgi:hypothetical protein
MGYAGFISKKISRALFAAKTRRSEPAVEAMRKGRNDHPASVTSFPIFCKKLSALIALAVAGLAAHRPHFGFSS